MVPVLELPYGVRPYWDADCARELAFLASAGRQPAPYLSSTCSTGRHLVQYSTMRATFSAPEGQGRLICHLRTSATAATAAGKTRETVRQEHAEASKRIHTRSSGQSELEGAEVGRADTGSHHLLDSAADAAHTTKLRLPLLPTTTNPSFSTRSARAAERRPTYLQTEGLNPAGIARVPSPGICCTALEPAVHVQTTQLVNTLNMLRRRAPSDWTALAPTTLTYPEARAPPREPLYRPQGLQGRSSSSSGKLASKAAR